MKRSHGWIVRAAVGLWTLCLAAAAPGGEKPALIPWPQDVKWTEGAFAPASVRLQAPAALERQAGNVLRECGFALADGTGGTVNVRFELGKVDGAKVAGGAYRIRVDAGGVQVVAPAAIGLQYGLQTLRQLAGGKARIPCCEITDWPAFEWRGFMHDVGRNPQDVDLLKRFIDVMAQYKLSVFHFHLTDNPGYRIECRVHPELNDPKYMLPTRRPGFFYTYAQINDLVGYCRDRGIMVVPEIDMPGHSDYFKRAFGVEMQSEKGTVILRDAVNEFLDNVQTEFFHMGSDEVSLKNAKFMDAMADLIRKRGRKLLVWRPGHLPKGNVIAQLWAKGAPVNGLAAVDSRDDYINHLDAFDGPPRIMNLGSPQTLGGILCHWPDNNAGEPMNIYRQSPVFPSLLAAAERYWTGRTPCRPEYWGRLAPDFAVFEDRMIAHRDLYFRDWPFPYVRQSGVVWKLLGPLPPEAPAPAETDFAGGVAATGATIHVNHFWYDGWLPKAKAGVAYAQTYLYSPRAQSVGFWINFNGPSRSGRDSPNPDKGLWSNTGSQVWVNGREVPAPDWKQPGKQTSEVPFVDEDYFYRDPTPVPLEQGWNRILIRHPRTAGIRKWMFTCVPVVVEGGLVREVPDLRFATQAERP